MQVPLEGLFKDKDGSLVMITKLTEGEYLFTHEKEGTCIIDEQGRQILGKYSED